LKTEIEPFVHETNIRVRYQETDQMGVVYHTNYLVWFEVGRSDLIRQIGISYQELENMGLLLPVVEVNCTYRSPAHYDEEVCVRTQIQEMTGGKLVFQYEIVRLEDGQQLVTGYTKHLWVNKEMKRTNLERKFPHVYELLLKAYAKER
jgi:acyl-CoA thioester hydrolase